MIKVDENDPVGELQPSFPYRDVVIRRNVDVKDYYELESEIGRGKFGTVYRCTEKSTGIKLAAKFVGIARRQDRRNVEREVEIMRTLQHPRLIQLYDAFESNSVMCVIQELIEGGELFERVIDDDFILTEKACTVFMRQICEGVEFIHSQNILHLDLKPENILCLTRTGNRIKIIDFGLARKFEPDKKLQVLFGTPEFVAPEVVNFEQIGFGTDMWSVGVICYVLLSGLSPFMGETDVETMANVTIAQYDFDDDAFDDISDDAKDFISKLLMKNKEHRLTATECLSHVWLRRKPPPPPPPQLIQPIKKIELIPQPTQDELLDNTKENLREFVDRWSEQGSASPSKVISLPTIEPFREITFDNIKSPQTISDINKNLLKDETKFISNDSAARMDIDNNLYPNIKPQNLADKSENSIIKNDESLTDATQINNESEIPGKKIKLDTAVNETVNVNYSGNNVDTDSKLLSDSAENVCIANNTVPVPSESQSSSHAPSPKDGSSISSVAKSLSDHKLNLNITKKNFNSLSSPTKSQPSSPVGTIPKTPSSSKLKFNSVMNEVSDKNMEPVTLGPAIKQSPVEKNTTSVIKTPSSDKINTGFTINSNEIVTKLPEMKDSVDKLPINVMNSVPNNNVVSQMEEKLPVLPTTETNKDINSSNVIGNRSNETIYKPPYAMNIVGSRSNDTISKPPQVPNLGHVHKPKLVPQFSVPSDLNKLTLHKNIPVVDSLMQPKEITTNKSTKDNMMFRTNLQNNINSVDNKEITPLDGKFNKMLNKHVVPPKIHGIVLGQNDTQEDSTSLPEKRGPKVITHKIFVEGRSDPILPPTGSSSVNKENIKNESRILKPISKSQTSSKLELKENNDDNKNKIFGNRFLGNDKFDRRGSDISCFLHNTENLERINLADEIKKLSTRLFQMGKNEADDQESNVKTNPIPITSFKNDPIGQFLANHGVVTRRPKYRMSHLNRDVPIGSPPPASNLFYHLSHSNSDTWSDNQTHSAPQSPSASPERESTSLTRDVILRLFDKNSGSSNLPVTKEDDKHSAMSSIDSLASYFKTNNETKKNIPPVVTTK